MESAVRTAREVDPFQQGGWQGLMRFYEATSEMKKKPDLLLVLVLVLGLGVLASSYTQGEPDPEMVASQFTIR